MAEVKGKIVAKKSDNKAFKLGDNWYNLKDNVVPYLEKISKGEEVTVIYEQNKMTRIVSKIVKGNESSEKSESTQELKEGEVLCPACGKPKKADSFAVCYMCNKAGKKPGNLKPNTEKSSKSYYDNPEKTAQIQRGNALNAAATVASSQQFNDPEVAKQFTLILADEFLTWLRAE